VSPLFWLRSSVFIAQRGFTVVFHFNQINPTIILFYPFRPPSLIQQLSGIFQPLESS
jgi:hypothetical protein